MAAGVWYDITFCIKPCMTSFEYVVVSITQCSHLLVVADVMVRRIEWYLWASHRYTIVKSIIVIIRQSADLDN